MRYFILSIIIFAVLPLSASAQEAVLSKHDIELFIETFPKINTELTKLGMGIDTNNENSKLAEAFALSAKSTAIFTKRGWNEDYLVKASLILRGVYLLAVEEQILESSPDIQLALAELDETPLSPYFTLETKNQMRVMILSSIATMNQSLFTQMDSIASEDFELLRAKKGELKEILNWDD